METIFDDLMQSFDKIRKRKYSLLEQDAKAAAGKGEGRGDLAKRYNSILGGTAKLDDAQKNEIRSQLLQKLDVAPEQMNGTGGQFDPVYVPAQRAGSLPKVEFRNMQGTRILLSIGGGHTGINSRTLAGAVEFLKGLVSDDPEGQANTDAAQGPAAEPDIQSEEDGTQFDANTGQEIDPLAEYIPYEPTPEELEKAGRKIDGFADGITAENLLGAITTPPTGQNLTLNKFKRALLGGGDPNLAPEVQKELFDAYSDIIGVAKKIKEGRYLDDKDLTARERHLLDSVACKTIGGKKQLWVGRRGSRTLMDHVAPQLGGWLDEKSQETEELWGNQKYGISVGSMSHSLCPLFNGVDVRKENGESHPAVFFSDAGGGSGDVYKYLGTRKETVMVASLNAFFGQGQVSDVVESMEGFAQAIQDVCLGAQATDIERWVEADGNIGLVLDDQEFGPAAQFIMDEVESVDPECKEASLNWVKDSIRESYLLARVAKDAGVRPVSVDNLSQGSKGYKKADFVFTFATPEEAQIFADKLSQLGAGSITAEEGEDGSVGVSLKAKESFGSTTAGGNQYYGAAYRFYGADCAASTGQARTECEGQQDFYTHREKFLKRHGSPAQVKSARKAMEHDAKLSQAADVLFGDDARGQSAVWASLGIMLGNPVGDTETQRAVTEFRDDISTALKSHDPKKIGKVRARFLVGMRKMLAGNDPSLVEGFATNDMMSSFFTIQDEALLKAGRGQIRFSGNHQMAKHLLKKGSIVSTSSGFSWVSKDNKKLFGTTLYAKQPRPGATSYPLLSSSVTAVLFDALGTVIEDSMQSGEEEEIYGKLNELLKAIHVAVAK